jgi:hypothetical protein
LHAIATSLPPLSRSCPGSVSLFSRLAPAVCYAACPSTYPEHPVSSWLEVATALTAALPCIYPSAMTAIATRPALGIISRQRGRAKATLSCRSLAASKQCKDDSGISRYLDVIDPSAFGTGISSVPRLPHSLHVQAAAQQTVSRKRCRTGLPSMFEALRIKPCGVQASGLGMFLRTSVELPRLP